MRLPDESLIQNLSWKQKLTGLVAIYAVFLAIALPLKYTYVPRPPGELMRPFQSYGDAKDFDVWVAAPNLEGFADSLASDARSPFVIYEDDKPLGPAHSLHSDIAKLGHGRFSHWTGIGFIFSSSDGTSPGLNGRIYRAVKMPDRCDPACTRGD